MIRTYIYDIVAWFKNEDDSERKCVGHYTIDVSEDESFDEDEFEHECLDMFLDENDEDSIPDNADIDYGYVEEEEEDSDPYARYGISERDF